MKLHLFSVDSKNNKLRILISLVGNQNASRLLIENAKGRKMSGSILVKKSFSKSHWSRASEAKSRLVLG